MILFAVAIGVATFVENDFGTSAAQKLIFKTKWFELLLVFFGISILVNIRRYRMIKQKKWAILAFHAAIIVILIGAGVTRYTGFEGVMHIREGKASNSILSADTYLLFETSHQGRTYQFDEPVLFASKGSNAFEQTYLIGGQEVAVKLTGFMPNPQEIMMPDESGVPIIKIVFGGAAGREEYFVKYGNRSRIKGTLFNFGSEPTAQSFNIAYENNQLYFQAPTTFTQMVMATRQSDTLEAEEVHPLMLRSLYSDGNQGFVFGDFMPRARLDLTSTDPKMASNSMGGVKLAVSHGGETQEQYIFGTKGLPGRPRTFSVGGMDLAIAYGAKTVELPFELHLRDFIMDKYPGTNNASSYASEVTLRDPRSGLVEEQRIYMNNILDYDGYRFFQSSFDQDELGTYLSVNHDWWGTWISYLGYAMLTLGMIMTFFSKKSRFRQLTKSLQKSMSAKASATGALIILLLCTAFPARAKVIEGSNLRAPSREHAAHFSKLIMQDHRGRMKPMNTYTSEILRKLSRKESLYGLTPEQIILGMAAAPKDWYHVPLIKAGKHDKTRQILPTPEEGNLLTYSDFFETDGSYKLREYVRAAYNTPEKDRGVFEKEMMKLDEKVNICSMLFSGNFMKVFPVLESPANAWVTPHEGRTDVGSEAEMPFPQKFYLAYLSALDASMKSQDWSFPNQLISELIQYQVKFGKAVMPSTTKVQAEILLNKTRVFSRLGKAYGLLGLLFLGFLFASVFRPGINLKIPFQIGFGLFVLCFLAHLGGLGLRWYVSGRAPWSNGYESMIYIAFTASLAGLILGKRYSGILAATCMLSSTILMVAGLSWLDPEITPLVPVLKSYWLTIHVSLEAGSYGFLMLGALIGVLNLIFMIFRNQNNAIYTSRVIRTMTQISEMILIGGLFMISIGTYLGGVWANESWGRYWGWDAKETWALVSILVYAFILHMRFIPGLRGHFAFNVASLFGLASILMTYFGVNYYLSGLHSYAAGDPVPVPAFVYYGAATLTAISLLAYWRNRQFLQKQKAS